MNDFESNEVAVATDRPDCLPKQFTVMLQNRVGSLSSLVRLLRSNSIEVVGLSLQDSRDATMLRLVTSFPDKTNQLFLEKGIPFTQCHIVVIALRNVQLELDAALGALVAAETNIDFTYTLLSQPNMCSLMALHLEDAEFGANVLNKAGVKVLWQKDLLR